jgi:hypothetical protein
VSDEQRKADSAAENVTDDAAEKTPSAESQQTESKPAESKPADAGSTDSKPADSKPAESAPAASANGKPAAAGSSNSKPAASPAAVGAGEATQVIEQHQSKAPQRAPHTPGDSMRVVRKGLGLLASVVKLIGLIAALILVVHIVFVVAHANPANGLTGFIDQWAQRLTLGLSNLFQLTEPTLAVVVNYGVPAVVWLIVSAVVASVLRKI